MMWRYKSATAGMISRPNTSSGQSSWTFAMLKIRCVMPAARKTRQNWITSAAFCPFGPSCTVPSAVGSTALTGRSCAAQCACNTSSFRRTWSARSLRRSIPTPAERLQASAYCAARRSVFLFAFTADHNRRMRTGKRLRTAQRPLKLIVLAKKWRGIVAPHPAGNLERLFELFIAHAERWERCAQAATFRFKPTGA